MLNNQPIVMILNILIVLTECKKSSKHSHKDAKHNGNSRSSRQLHKLKVGGGGSHNNGLREIDRISKLEFLTNAI
jgi:hypothetical protein